MKTVLVIGGSRGIGLETVRYGLAKDYRVRAFSRSADSIAIRDPNLQKHKGDALEPDDVTSALDGVDAVIQAIGLPAGREMIFGPVNLFSRSTRVLLEAMSATSVRRLISVTGFGTGDSGRRMKCLHAIPFRSILGRVYNDKGVQEQIIRDSGLDWVIARPVILTKGRMSGHYRILVDPKDWRNGLIPRTDVAHFLIKQIGDDTYLRKTPVLLKCPI